MKCPSCGFDLELVIREQPMNEMYGCLKCETVVFTRKKELKSSGDSINMQESAT